MYIPKKIYLPYKDGKVIGLVKETGVPYKSGVDDNIEYTRTDAFIEKAAQFLYNYNQKQVLKHGARAILGCDEYTINVDEFRKYMEGD